METEYILATDEMNTGPTATTDKPHALTINASLVIEGILLVLFSFGIPLFISLMAGTGDFSQMNYLFELDIPIVPEMDMLGPAAVMASALLLGYAFAAELSGAIHSSGVDDRKAGLPMGKPFTVLFWTTALLCTSLFLIKLVASTSVCIDSLPAQMISEEDGITDSSILYMILLATMLTAPINGVLIWIFAARGWKTPKPKRLNRLACWFRTRPTLRWCVLMIALIIGFFLGPIAVMAIFFVFFLLSIGLGVFLGILLLPLFIFVAIYALKKAL